MIKRIILAVFDVQAQAYTGDPIFAVSCGVGERSFADACNNPELMFNKHPDDYELHEVGVFDVLTGEIVAASPRPVVYGKARAFLRPEVK